MSKPFNAQYTDYEGTLCDVSSGTLKKVETFFSQYDDDALMDAAIIVTLPANEASFKLRQELKKIDFIFLDEQGKAIDVTWWLGHDNTVCFDLSLFSVGYYHVTPVVDGVPQRPSLLLVSPGRCFELSQLSDHKIWGIAVQIYTLRSERNWGIGDFTDLESVVRHASKLGADIIGINPVHELFPSQPESKSPYTPSNRWFLNTIYIDLERVPGYRDCSMLQEWMSSSAFIEALDAVRKADYVDYHGVYRLKYHGLRLLYQWFDQHRKEMGEINDDFTQFKQQEGLKLALSSQFNVIQHQSEQNNQLDGWLTWSEALRENLNNLHANDENKDIEFFSYCQWLAEKQLQHVTSVAKGCGLKVGIYGDLAIGMARGGSETWYYREEYCQDFDIGCPADANNQMGQNWCFPPMNPALFKYNQYQPFIDVIRKNMKRVGAIRLDHIIGLSRLWWIPRPGEATDGVYVNYPIEVLLTIVAIESQRHQCVVVGEDMGVLPDGFDQWMEKYGLLSYKVFLFEWEGGQPHSQESYKKNALASISTHDLPTLNGYSNGWDIHFKESQGLYKSESSMAKEKSQREQFVQFFNTIDIQDDDGDGIKNYCHRYLAGCNSNIVLLQMEDLTGIEASVNVPGTVSEYNNWARKIDRNVEQIFSDSSVVDLLNEVNSTRKSMPV